MGGGKEHTDAVRASPSRFSVISDKASRASSHLIWSGARPCVACNKDWMAWDTSLAAKERFMCIDESFGRDDTCAQSKKANGNKL